MSIFDSIKDKLNEKVTEFRDDPVGKMGEWKAKAEANAQKRREKREQFEKRVHLSKQYTDQKSDKELFDIINDDSFFGPNREQKIASKLSLKERGYGKKNK